MTALSQRSIWLGYGLLAAGLGLIVMGLRATYDTPEPRELPQVEVPDPGVEAPARQADKPSAVECYLGVVVASEAVDVVAETAGRVEEVQVQLGDVVTRHQQLAVLDTETVDHQLAIEHASLSTAEAQQRRSALATDRAEQEHRRRLALEDLISQQDIESSKFQLDSAKVELDVAKAAVAQVQARIEQLETRLDRCKIRAPFDGKVALRYLDAGAVVTPGTPVVRLIGSGGLFARFAVPPEQAASVSLGMPLRVEIETLQIVAQGEVRHISPEIDADSQTVIIEASLEPPPEPRLAIPAGAVVRVSAQTGEDSPSCLDSSASSRLSLAPRV